MLENVLELIGKQLADLCRYLLLTRAHRQTEHLKDCGRENVSKYAQALNETLSEALIS